MGQNICIYVHLPWQIQKRGVLELLIAQRFELMVGIESRQASLTQNQGPTAPESRISGAAIVVISYLLLQLERIASEDLVFSVLNAVGAAMILYSLAFDFNFSAMVIEGFWVLISIIGIWKYYRGRHATRPTEI